MKVVNCEVHYKMDEMVLTSHDAYQVAERLIVLSNAAREGYNGEYVPVKSLVEGDAVVIADSGNNAIQVIQPSDLPLVKHMFYEEELVFKINQ